ncbi:MAG: hypothetical protein GWO78_04350 [Dehalococcoidales bacterium]|jgi:uncharacterized protein|nr:cyclophilin-like fold protein [Dehalococcoidia bacterium]NCG35208.1 hypothetical protein [Dehalococcoidales bacterium]
MREIIFDFGDFFIEGILNDSPTSNLFYDLLPMNGESQIWGDEIYFSTQIKIENDDWAKETVELGDIAFWPPGNALCLFFGSTPISAPNEIRPASPTNIMGKINGDLELLKNVKPGDNIKVMYK